MKRTRIAALTLTLGLSLGAHAHAQVHLERVPGVFRDVARSEESVALPLAGDEEGLLVEIGFPFVFYGQTFSQLGVTTNGYVTVGAAVSPDNDALPNAFLPNGVLAPFWDDLDTRPNPDARILMERAGPEGARVLTIQWTGLALKADPAARLTFQVLLFEGTNEVLFHYGPMKNGDGTEGTGLASGASATIGVESPDGRNGVPVSFDTPGVARQGVGFAFLPRAGAPLPEGRKLGDLDGDGEVTILDQSRQVELTSARYRPATALELVAADVAPLDSNDALWGDGTLRVSDRDLISRVIVGRDTLAPYLSDLLPGAVAPLTTLTLIGSGFDPSAAENNVVTLPRAGGGTLSLPAATVNATGSRLSLLLPADARRGDVVVRVNGRRTNARTLAVQGVPSILALAPTPAVIGEHLAIGGLELPAQAADVRVTIGGLPATVVSLTTGPDTGQGPTRIITMIVPADLTPGPHAVVVSRVNGASSEPVTHAFGDLPVVAITAPADDADIRDRVTVTGTVQDADLARYELAYAPLEGGDWVTFFTGTEPVVSGALGTFDPTMLLNGYYRLRLRAVDAQGLTAEATVRVSVQGSLKLGHFTLAFVDFELPTSGIAIQVVREYDSRDKQRRDFGVGWAMNLVTLEVQEEDDHSVIVDNPSSNRLEFRFDPINRDPSGIRQDLWTARFVANEPGERTTLDFETPFGLEPDRAELFYQPAFGNYFWNDGTPFDPRIYRLVQLDGTVLRVDDELGLLQVIKPTGVTLTITREGILHSAGRSVHFARDGLDRIIAIRDPSGAQQSYEYDAAGDLVRQTDALGFSTNFSYDSSHYLREWFDPRGVRVQRNEYDDEGRLIATIDPFGNRLEFEHDLDGRREVVRDKAGRPTVTEYDERGRATRIIGPDGAYEEFTHNQRDQVLTRRDRSGRIWSYEYDAAGNQSATVDPEGNRIEYTYDDAGRLLTVTDADGGLTRNTYDEKGHLLSTEDPAGGVITYTYNDRGLLTSVTNEAGQTTTYSYREPDGEDVIKEVDPAGQVTLFTHDANGNVLTETKVVSVPGRPVVRSTTTYAYDATGQRTSVVRPDGTTEHRRHGAGGRMVEWSDSSLRRQSFTYDELGRLEQRISGDGRSERRSYDVHGQLTAIEDEHGRREAEYDLRGNLTKVKFADGTFLENEFDTMNRLRVRVDARGQRWTYEYDGAGRRTKEVAPDGGETTYEYDGRGNVVAVTDADGRTTRYEYDGVCRLLRVRFPDGRSEEVLERDTAGRVTARTDLFGHVSRFSFGAFDERTRIDLASGAWLYGRDARGHLTSVTDPNDHTTTHEYDALTGKRTRTTLPLQQVAYYSWADGLLRTKTDFDGRTTEMEYDGRGNLVYRLLPDGTGERLTYDDRGRLERVEDARGTSRFERDAAGRLTRRIEPDGRSIAYEYDPEGNVTRVKTSAGTTSLSYDERERLTSITDVNSRTTTFEYTKAGVLRRISRPSGITSEFTHDLMGRLTLLTHSGPSGTIASYAYEYDENGRRSRAIESARTVDYRYDATGRLVSETSSEVSGVTSVTYAYDGAGNRLSKTTLRPDLTTLTTTYTYDENDRLIREDVVDTAPGQTPSSIVYAYDPCGRVVSRTAPGEVATYGYDGLGRLTSAVVIRGSNRDEVQYVYDHFGNRTTTIRNGQVTNHLVDANRPISQVVQDTSADGTVVATYVQGRFPLGQTSGTEAYELLFDGQLSTRHVVDGTGQVVSSFDFDAFGVLRGQTGPTPVHLLYAGESFEPITGLYFLRSRYLDPRVGRFLTRDEFEGFEDDPRTLHAYVYALQDPVNRVDPPGTYSYNLQCQFALDIPAALQALDAAYADRRVRKTNAARLRDLLRDLNVFMPHAFDLIQSDRDLAIAFNLISAGLEPRGPERLNASNAPVTAARTFLFGSKAYARLGAGFGLASARQEPAEDFGTARQRLVWDDVCYPERGPNGKPRPGQAEAAARVTGLDIFQEVYRWLNSVAGSGDVVDIDVADVQRQADGEQVGMNRPHLAFTVAATNVRWNIMFARADSPTLDEIDRIVTNDPRCIALELREDATLADFHHALRTNGDTGPPARHILSFTTATAEFGRVTNHRIIREAIPERNKPAASPQSSITVGSGVYAHSGEFVLERTDLKVPGRGLDWEFRRVYRSGLIYPPDTRMPLGHNWTTNYDVRLGTSGAGALIEIDANARMVDQHLERLGQAAEAEGADLDPPPGVFRTVVQTGVRFRYLLEDRETIANRVERGYIRRGPNGELEGFNAAGWLVWQRDRFGNTIELLRDPGHLLCMAIDTVGRRYIYEYTPGTEQLRRVVDVTGGREVTFEIDENLDLRAVTAPGDRREEYTYSTGNEHPALNHNLIAVRFPTQVAAGEDVFGIVNTYNDTDPLAFDFDSVTVQDVGGRTGVQLADGSQQVVDAGGRYFFDYHEVSPLRSGLETNAVAVRTRVTDRRGHTAQFLLNRNGNPVEFIDEAGFTTTHRYDENGMRVETVHPNGQREYMGYDRRNPIPSQRGNLIFRAQFPAPKPGEQLQAIVSEFDYDPFFNQLRRVSDTEAFQPVFNPPPVDLEDSRTWLTPSAEYSRYTNLNVFDYEEGDAPPVLPISLEFLFDFDYVTIKNDRSALDVRWHMTQYAADLNSDGEKGRTDPFDAETYSGPGFRGVNVKTYMRRVATRTGPDQSIEMITQYNAAGQVSKRVDAMGCVTTFEYFSDGTYDAATGAYPGLLRRMVGDDAPLPGVTRRTSAPPVRAVTTFEYDAYGNVRKRVDPIGGTVLTTYEPSGVVKEEIRGADDPALSYLTRFEYDHDLRLTATFREDRGAPNSSAGRFFEARAAYDVLGNVVEEATRLTEDEWLATRHTYDPEQLRLSTTFPEGNSVSWTYDARRLRVTETLGVGTEDEATTTWSYDPGKKVVRHTTPDGDATEFRHDGFDRVKDTVAANGSVERRLYDPSGELVVVERHGRTGGPTPRDNDETGNVLLSRVEYVRDSKRRVIQTRASLFGPGLTDETVVSHAEYDLLDRIVAVEEPDGQRTTYAYDGMGRALEVRDALGNSVINTYDAIGNLTARREVERASLAGVPDETFETVLDYDTLSRLVLARDSAHQAYRFQYDSRDNVVVSFDAVGVVDSSTGINVTGNKTTVLFDAANRKVATIYDLTEGGLGGQSLDLSNPFNEDGQVTLRYEYDTNSRLVAIVDDSGNRTRYEYDALNRPVAEVYADGTRTTTAYNRDGTVLRVTDPNGTVSNRTYDSVNRLIEVNVLRAEGVRGTTRETYEYDGLDRVVRCTDDNGDPATVQVVERTYDSLSRVLAERQNGSEVRSTWTQDGKRLTLRYPGGRQLAHAYDAIDRLTEIRDDVDGAVSIASSDFVGPVLRTLRRQHANRTTLSFADHPTSPTRASGYDLARRVVGLRHHRPDGVPFVDREYGYNRANRRTSVTRHDDGGQTDRYEFDSLYRAVAVHYDRDGTGYRRPRTDVGYLLDGVGNRRTQLESLAAGDVDVTAGDPATIPGGPAPPEGVLDDHGNSASASTLLAIDTPTAGAVQFAGDQDWFRVALRSGIEYTLGASSLASGVDVRVVLVDPTGMPTAMATGDQPLTHVAATTGFHYVVIVHTDAEATEGSYTLTLSAATSRTRAYTVNAINQYVAIDETARTYSPAGDLLSDGRLRFEYDYRHRIAAVRRHSDGKLIARYLYDCENRRTRKVVHDVDGDDAAAVTHFYYDGWREIEEQDGAGRTTATYVLGSTHLDDVVQISRTQHHPLGAATLYLHQDARGDVVSVTDAGGAVVERRVYDDFGQSYDARKDPVTGSAVGNPFGFQGRRLDDETGLYYFRHRYYDPSTGRFLQRDPVWDAGNLGNQYTFGWNDPGSMTDPLGQFVMPMVMALFAAWADLNLSEVSRAWETGWRPEPDRLRLLGEGFINRIVGGAFGILQGVGVVAIGVLFPPLGAVLSLTAIGLGAADLVAAVYTGDLEGAKRGTISFAACVIPGRTGLLVAAADMAIGTDDVLEGAGEEEFDNCFLAGTNVETASRGDVKVEDVRVGDRVAPPPGHSCDDPRCGEVVRLFRNETDRVVTITAVARPRAREHRAAANHGGEAGEEDGEPPSASQMIRCTPGHPFFVQGRGWVFAGDLRVGDELEARGELVIVAAVEVRTEQAATFNFEVACHHTYYVAGHPDAPAVLVHNTSWAARAAAAAGRAGRLKRAAGAVRAANTRRLDDIAFARQRAAELRTQLGDQSFLVGAVGVARDRGVRRIILSTNETGIPTALRNAARPGEILAPGLRGRHAEQSVEALARGRGWHLGTEGATIAHCPGCWSRMDARGIWTASERAAISRRWINQGRIQRE